MLKASCAGSLTGIVKLEDTVPSQPIKRTLATLTILLVLAFMALCVFHGDTGEAVITVMLEGED